MSAIASSAPSAHPSERTVDAQSAPAAVHCSLWSVSLGLAYALGSLACGGLALTSPPWTLALMWVAFSCALVSLGHLGLGGRVYGRIGGSIPASRRWMLAWDRWGQAISRWYYRRKDAGWTALAPNVWFGGWPDALASRCLLEAGVTAVVDLSAEFDTSDLARAPSVKCLFMDLLDLSVPSLRDMGRASAFISEQSREGIVYIHCKAGSFRSAAVAGAWLIATGRSSDGEAAVRWLESARAGLRVRKPIRDALEAFARELADSPAPRPVWLRDIQHTAPDLFDLVFAIQDQCYRRSRLTRGLVWSYEAFRERALGYVIFGNLPSRKEDGRYPSLEEALAMKTGFVLGRLLPEGGPFVCLKLSIFAGNRQSAADACRQALRSRMVVIAAVENRLAEAAVRIGFRSLPPWAAKLLVPLCAPAFVQAPWELRGVGSQGQAIVTHPDFRDQATGQQVLYEKVVIHSPGAMLRLLRPRHLAALLRIRRQRSKAAAR